MTYKIPLWLGLVYFFLSLLIYFFATLSSHSSHIHAASCLQVPPRPHSSPSSPSSVLPHLWDFLRSCSSPSNGSFSMAPFSWSFQWDGIYKVKCDFFLKKGNKIFNSQTYFKFKNCSLVEVRHCLYGLVHLYSGLGLYYQ